MSPSDTEPYPLLEPSNASTRLKQSKQAILDLWEKRVRGSLSAARQFDPPALIDTLPAVLDRLIEALSGPKPRIALQTAEKDLAKAHGIERAFLAPYTLDQVISEYHLLRNVLFEVLEGDIPLSLEEREIITDALFISIRNAAAEFARARESKQQAAHERLKKSHSGMVTKLQENVTELEFSRELLNSIHREVQDFAIFTLDSNGIITTWNQGAARMYQYTAVEVIGKHFSMLYAEDGRRRNEPMSHLQIAAGEGRFRGEGLRTKKSGKKFLADALITPMRRDGKLFGFGKIVQDLSERNQLIQERDISYSQTQALQIEHELREKFIFTLTHDLRNPLSAVRAGCDMISRTPCNLEKHRELSRRCIQSIKRIDRMITDLLDASRIKAGEALPISVSKCDLRQVLDEVQGELTTVYGSRFLIDADQSVTGFWSREGLKRVMENLATNAIKYGDPSTPVTLSLHQVDDRVHFKVHNYGPTIQNEEISSLFRPFQRTKEAQKSSKKGWGLGLTLVYGITEAHKGRVKVESYAKEGTTFTLDLPRDTRPFLDRKN